MELKISKTIRDQIIDYLPTITVSAQVGASLMEIVKVLNSLEEVGGEIKQEEAKP